MTEPGRHGGPRPVPVEALLDEDDFAILLVDADAHAWSEAHPCDCDALCVCDADE